MKRSFLFFALSLFLTSSASALIPNDPHVLQWGYEDTGVYRAWDTAQGSRNVVVAVVDNGFDMFHPDLLNNVWKNEDEIPDNGVDDDQNGYIDDVWGWNFVPEDTNGSGGIDANEARGNNDPRPRTEEGASNGIIHHGTVVAGILGAVGNNNLDGAGVNWRVRLMNIKVLDNTGSGSFVSLGDAIRYAVDNGADIINLSVVGNTNDDLEAAIDYAYKQNVVIVAAAGNDNIDLNVFKRYPVCSGAGDTPEKIIGVSAITEAHRITFYSNIGSDCVDLTAPGEDISSTLRFSPNNNLTERYGDGWGGTSFAAPFVSGTAALLKGIHPEWGPSEIFEAIISTVHHTPGQDEAVYANLFGAGLLQVDKALAYAREVVVDTLLDFGGALSSGILSINVEDGVAQNHDPHTGISTQNAETGALQDIDDITTYQTNGLTTHVSVKEKDADTRRVEFFTGDWALKQSWDVAALGPVTVSVGNVVGDESLEIVVAPEYVTDTLFWVYSLNGGLLYTQTASQKMDGTSVAIRPSEEKEHSDITVLVKEGDSVVLYLFSGSGDEMGRFIVDGLQQRGSVAVADIDGDGTGEYIVGAGVGETAFLLYYASDGRLLRKFWAYAEGYQGGFSIDVVDYDNNGKDDVIVAPTSGSAPIRVWNYRSQKLGEWWPFGMDRPFGAIVTILFD